MLTSILLVVPRHPVCHRMRTRVYAYSRTTRERISSSIADTRENSLFPVSTTGVGKEGEYESIRGGIHASSVARFLPISRAVTMAGDHAAEISLQNGAEP